LNLATLQLILAIIGWLKLRKQENRIIFKWLIFDGLIVEGFKQVLMIDRY
jgi:hypothetical protein